MCRQNKYIHEHSKKTPTQTIEKISQNLILRLYKALQNQALNHVSVIAEIDK